MSFHFSFEKIHAIKGVKQILMLATESNALSALIYIIPSHFETETVKVTAPCDRNSESNNFIGV